MAHGKIYREARGQIDREHAYSPVEAVRKLKVLVDIFERQVPVELGFDQVKKLD